MNLLVKSVILLSQKIFKKAVLLRKAINKAKGKCATAPVSACMIDYFWQVLAVVQ